MSTELDTSGSSTVPGTTVADKVGCSITELRLWMRSEQSSMQMEQRYDKILQNVVRDFEEYESTIKVHRDNVYDVPTSLNNVYDVPEEIQETQEVGSEEAESEAESGTDGEGFSMNSIWIVLTITNKKLNN